MKKIDLIITIILKQPEILFSFGESFVSFRLFENEMNPIHCL